MKRLPLGRWKARRRSMFTGGASLFSSSQRPEGQHYLREAALLGGL